MACCTASDEKFSLAISLMLARWSASSATTRSAIVGSTERIWSREA
jgi:hypothetical protein